jgi:hypothetical protein
MKKSYSSPDAYQLAWCCKCYQCAY